MDEKADEAEPQSPLEDGLTRPFDDSGHGAPDAVDASQIGAEAFERNVPCLGESQGIYFRRARSSAEMEAAAELAARGHKFRLTREGPAPDDTDLILMLDTFYPDRHTFAATLERALWMTEFAVREEGRGRFGPRSEAIRPIARQSTRRRPETDAERARSEARDSQREAKYRARIKNGWKPKGDVNRFLIERRWNRAFIKEARSNLLNEYLSSLSMEVLGRALTVEGHFMDADALEMLLTYDPWIRELWGEPGIDGAIRRAAEGAVEAFDPEIALAQSLHGTEMAQKSRAKRNAARESKLKEYAAYISKYPKVTDSIVAADFGVSTKTVQNWRKALSTPNNESA
ncbi:hypothetical protein GCM10009786_11720 [Leucobacter alluvii]|uniref:Homeodomain-like domain-containing protein n=1 Tax=Leucobacter alluvii TaxID=340321 RepID=A0ABN3B4F6_9MICO